MAGWEGSQQLMSLGAIFTGDSLCRPAGKPAFGAHEKSPEAFAFGAFFYLPIKTALEGVKIP